MTTNQKVGYINDETIGLTTTVSFIPVTDESQKKLGEMFISEKASSVINTPVLNGEIVSVRKNGGQWEVPVVELYGRETIQESIDGEMKKKINATGETEVIGYMSLNAEVNGETVAVNNIIITVFKIDEMGDFNETMSYDERFSKTIEEVAKDFDDAPMKFEGDNVFLHIMEVAVRTH